MSKPLIEVFEEERVARIAERDELLTKLPALEDDIKFASEEHAAATIQSKADPKDRQLAGAMRATKLRLEKATYARDRSYERLIAVLRMLR